MAREKYHTRLDPGTVDRLTEYKDANGIEQDAEALRRVIRAGLAAKGYPEVRTDGAGGWPERARNHAEFYTEVGAFGLFAAVVAFATSGQSPLFEIALPIGVGGVVLAGALYLTASLALRHTADEQTPAA